MEGSGLTQRAYSPETLGFDTFLLGVGAQRAGTTWLYAYLTRHPACAMPVIKELHFFDSLFQRDIYAADPDARARERIRKFRDSDDALERDIAWQSRLRVKISGDFDRYLEFFHDLDIRCRLSGDITPTYASLSQEHLWRIRGQLADAGLKVRVVFLMRDPVARYLSAVRMMAVAQNAQQDPALVKRRMMQKLKRPPNMARSRYDRTVRNLRAVFTEDELYVQFFEYFFQESEIRRLCKFLSIPYAPANLDLSPNATRQDFIQFTNEDRAAVYEALRPVYDGCREIFGDRIPDSWMKAP